jgi:hypothetical protein
MILRQMGKRLLMVHIELLPFTQVVSAAGEDADSSRPLLAFLLETA